MPAVTAIEVKCPECGARLPVAGQAETAKCSYCGTESRVQRRTQVLQRRVELAPAPHLPTRIAPQVRTKGAWIVPVVLTAIGMGAGVWGMLKGFGILHSPTWYGGYPTVVDVNGDGVDDLIGFDRNVQRDTMKLMALSGTNGDVLWESSSLGGYTSVYQDDRSAVNGLILVWDKTAHVMGFDVKTGARRWSTTAQEVVVRACTSKTGGAVLETADKRAWTLDLASGAIAPGTATCPAGTEHAPEPDERDSAITVPGMSIDHTFSRDRYPRIVRGHRSPGTAVPMVAAVDADGRVVWQSEVPGANALQITGTVKAATSKTEVAAAYERDGDRSVMLTAFDRTTGKRLFEVETKKVFQNVLSDLDFTNKDILVITWGSLQAFDAVTGKRLFAITD